MRSTSAPFSARLISLIAATALFCGAIVPGHLTVAQSSSKSVSAGKQSAPALERVAQMKASAGDRGVFIEWRTGFEIDIIGFNVYREQNGHREMLNPGIIAGSALIAGQGTAADAGGSYSWFDSAGTIDCRYYIEDIDISSHSTIHPAIIPEWTSRLTPYTQSRLLSDLGAANAARESEREWAGTMVDKSVAAAMEMTGQGTLSDQWDIANQAALKIGVRTNGWYRITQAEMAAAGFNTSGEARNLRMFVNASEIAILVSRNSGPLTSSDYIEFWGEGVDFQSTDTQIYWLVNGNQQGKRVARVAELKPDSGAPTSPSPKPN